MTSDPHGWIKHCQWACWKAVVCVNELQKGWLQADIDPRSSCQLKNRPTQSIMRNGNLPRLLWPVTFGCLKISKNGAHGQESARNFTQEWHLASNPLGKFWKITPCTRSHIHCHLIIALAWIACKHKAVIFQMGWFHTTIFKQGRAGQETYTAAKKRANPTQNLKKN